MFNAYRKTVGDITEIHTVVYARRPIVRFIYEKSLVFEVSIRNLLGEIKANFVGNIVAKESSGNLY